MCDCYAGWRCVYVWGDVVGDGGRAAKVCLPLGRAMPSGLDSVLRMCLATSPADRPSFFEAGI